MAKSRHPLIASLLSFRGNPRITLFTDPLFSIPFNLITPFAALYMRALGLSDPQIGLLSTIIIAIQMATSLFTGIAADKLGRRNCVFYFDILTVFLPYVIYAVAQNFTYFLIASFLRGLSLFTSSACSLLMTEDARPGELVNYYNWVTISGLMAVFFTPIAGLLVWKLSLVPAIRIVYVFAAVCSIVKSFLLFFLGAETAQGKRRMAESRGEPVWRMFVGYKDILRQVLHSPATLMAVAIMLVLYVTNLISNNFFALYATECLGVPEGYVTFFPMARSAIMLIFMFSVQPLLERMTLRRPMALGFVLYLVAHAALLLCPVKHFLLLAVYILLDAMSYALVYPRKDSMMVLFVNQRERARIQSMMFTLSLAISAPFGWIGGWLSSLGRTLPFLLNMGLFALALLLVLASPYFKRSASDGVVQEIQQSDPPSVSA